MYREIFSNMFMVGFYLYFFNKFCSNYLKTHFGKSILSIVYLTIIYKILSFDYIIKNLIIISFIGLISYENDYINDKIGYFDKNEKIKNIQKYLINGYEKLSSYLNYIFMFYDKIIGYFKSDYLKLSGNNIELDITDNEEMEIMFNKMKEMLNDIDMNMKIKKNINKKKEKYDVIDNIYNHETKIDDVEIKETKINNNMNMENFLNSIISEIQPLLNNEDSSINNDFILNNFKKDISKINENNDENEYNMINEDTLINNYNEMNTYREINENSEINEDTENFEEYITQ